MTPHAGKNRPLRGGPIVECTQERRFAGVALRPLVAATKRALEEGLGLAEAHVSLALVGDESMTVLNGRWRNKHTPTDVLSFPLARRSPRTKKLPPDVHLGDIALCVPQAKRQAGSRGHALQEELLVLLVHGLLHLCGHDHVRGGRQAAAMRSEEMRLLKMLSPKGRALRCLLATDDDTP